MVTFKPYYTSYYNTSVLYNITSDYIVVVVLYHIIYYILYISYILTLYPIRTPNCTTNFASRTTQVYHLSLYFPVLPINKLPSAFRRRLHGGPLLLIRLHAKFDLGLLDVSLKPAGRWVETAPGTMCGQFMEIAVPFSKLAQSGLCITFPRAEYIICAYLVLYISYMYI